MKIAIYGGKFNPPHLAHQFAIFTLLTKFNVSCVYVVPSFSKHPFNLPTGDFAHRTKMCELLIAPFNNSDYDEVILSTIEEGMPKPVYAVDLLREFKKMYVTYPTTEFAIIMGEDNWDKRDKWKHFDELEKEAEIIVFGRKFDMTGRFTPLPGISSSLVRTLVNCGRGVNHLVPAGVAEYISENKLYVD